MSEISKLKARLKNAGKNSIEYRMTIDEAKKLVGEIEYIESELNKKPIEKTVEIIKKEPEIQKPVLIKILDGGSF